VISLSILLLLADPTSPITLGKGHVMSCDGGVVGKSDVLGEFCDAALYPLIPAKNVAAAFGDACVELLVELLEYRKGSSASLKGLPGSLKRTGNMPELYRRSWPSEFRGALDWCSSKGRPLDPPDMNASSEPASPPLPPVEGSYRYATLG
jgi:hypothetical protein